MPTTIAALRGRFGRIDYWLTTMRIGELVTKIQMPIDMEGWEELSIEEKFQRDVNIKRVVKEVAPYFARDENRFSGALVLAILNSDNIAFEAIGEFPGSPRVPALYQSASRDIGFLTLNGEEMLVPIDGQHRAKAFKFAMTGTDDNGRPIAGVRSNTALAEDQVAVILMRFDAHTSRLIFNKINRYAKPTAKADNLLTDDDDAVAVITRALLGEDGVIRARLVRLSGNTLPTNAMEFTTLSTFHEINLAIVNELPGTGKPSAMNEAQRELALEEMRKTWDLLLARIDLFASALSDTRSSGDGDRIRIRDEMVLGKPIGQRALVRAFLLMRDRCQGVGDSALCERLNRIDWRMGSLLWENVLVAPNGRILSGRTTVNTARLYIAHLCGANLTDQEQEGLLERIHGADWEADGHQLPEAVV